MDHERRWSTEFIGIGKESGKLIPQTIDNALYIIDKIRPEVERGNFRGIVRYCEQLALLAKYAAIVQERDFVSGRPIIRMSNDY